MNTQTPQLHVLRHKKTKRCMPLLRGGGYSHWEPTLEPGKKENGVVRLFQSEHAARIAGLKWVQGRHSLKTVTTYGVGLPYDVDPEIVIEPVPGRSLNDLEIVPVDITYRTPVPVRRPK